MPGLLQPPGASSQLASDAEEEREHLRILTRSPHPYHRQRSEILEPSDRLLYAATALDATVISFAKDSTPASESGTEADDEHFLKGLPAPKQRLHKGLRGRNEPLSGSSTPLLSPAVLEEEGRKSSPGPTHGLLDRDKRALAEKSRRRKELIRRSMEVLLLACQAGLVASNQDVQPFLQLYRRGKAYCVMHIVAAAKFTVCRTIHAALDILCPRRCVSPEAGFLGVQAGRSVKAYPDPSSSLFRPSTFAIPPYYSAARVATCRPRRSHCSAAQRCPRSFCHAEAVDTRGTTL